GIRAFHVTGVQTCALPISAENPHVYVQSNVVGFLHILEGCRHHGVEHLVYASTSSVYGANTAMPFSEHASAEHPLTLYAATKKEIGRAACRERGEVKVASG